MISKQETGGTPGRGGWNGCPNVASLKRNISMKENRVRATAQRVAMQRAVHQLLDD